MADRAVVQTIETEFSFEIFFGRQRKRHQNTDLLCINRQFATCCHQKAIETKLGVFKFGKLLQNSFIQLYQSDEISGKSRKRLDYRPRRWRTIIL